jgi:hypothetical protein
VLAPWRRSSAAFGDLEADQRPFQGGTSGHEVRGLEGGIFDDLFGFAAGTIRPGNVDVGRHVGGLREDDDAVGPNLQEAAEDGELLLFAVALETQDAGAEQGDERRVVRQDAERAFAAGHDDLVDIALEDPSLRSDYL